MKDLRISLFVFVSMLLFAPGFANADNVPATALGNPVAVGVPLQGTHVSYGDLVIFDPATNVYTLSQYSDDSRIYGVVAYHPSVVLLHSASDVPVYRQGDVLVNVTTENGPISVGDGIIASSLSGKGMRAATSSIHVIGIAEEPFSGASSSTAFQIKGKSVRGGTILVDIGEGSGGGASASANHVVVGGFPVNCTPGTITCSVLQKINAAPLVTLMRYLIAAILVLGSLYMAFRTFMANAINGVVSVGRNPRAKGSIQAMVFFNALLAVIIAIIGLGVGLFILFIQI